MNEIFLNFFDIKLQLLYKLPQIIVYQNKNQNKTMYYCSHMHIHSLTSFSINLHHWHNFQYIDIKFQCSVFLCVSKFSVSLDNPQTCHEKKSSLFKRNCYMFVVKCLFLEKCIPNIIHKKWHPLWKLQIISNSLW